MADELISRNELLSLYGNDDSLRVSVGVVKQNILDMPTIKAEPIKRGHWVENNGRYGWYCSQCKKENNYAYHYNKSNAIELQDHYCPNCGAKIDEEE